MGLSVGRDAAVAGRCGVELVRNQPTPPGRLGTEASMLAHAASYGVIWEPALPPPPERLQTVVWTERNWMRWHMGKPGTWTGAERRSAAR